MRANPHSVRRSAGVRTFILAGLQKNADKADIITGLHSRSVHVCTCVLACMREHMHGQNPWAEWKNKAQSESTPRSHIRLVCYNSGI